MTVIFRLRYEISFLFLALTVGVLTVVSARGLPEPTYEPVGAAAFPSGIGIITILLVLFKSYRIFTTKKISLDIHNDDEKHLSFYRSFCMLLVLIAFVALVCFFGIRFWVSAFLFMLLAMSFLKRSRSFRDFIMQSVVLISFSLVLDYVVTDILYFNF